MKIHFIGIRWSTIYLEILELQNRFKKDHIALSLLYELETGLGKVKPVEKWIVLTTPPEIIIRLNRLLDVILEDYETEDGRKMMSFCRMILDEINACELLFGAYAGCPQNKQAEYKTRLRRFIKEIRQEYWLAWLEDFYCCKVEQALAACMAALVQDAQERLFIVAFPEFVFTDFLTRELEPFYKNVAYKFLHGLLDKSISRTGGHLKTLIGLTNNFHYGNRELLIFAGTIIWKNFGKFYNQAPVFFHGSCIFVWEKQLISGEDGKSKEVQHRHPVGVGSRISSGIRPGSLQAGILTIEMLRELNSLDLRPVFQLIVFGRLVKFAITVCKDLEAQEIIGNHTADIHILIAAGMVPNTYGKLSQICAERIFLYCDQTCGNVAMYCMGDKTLWTKYHIVNKWTNIDLQALDARFRSRTPADTVSGICIAPNVEDL